MYIYCIWIDLADDAFLIQQALALPNVSESTAVSEEAANQSSDAASGKRIEFIAALFH